MMIPIREEIAITKSRVDSSNNLWFYLSFEFIIGIIIFGVLTLLSIIKSFLPKPPRNLTGDIVLIVGISSTLGESLAEKFAENGCSVICVDDDLESAERIANKLKSRFCQVEEIGPEHRKRELQNATRPTMAAYKCDLLDRDAIRKIARKVEDEIGGIDILVTCVGLPNQDIFDTASMTLMSHYWTVLAFLPSMLRRDRGHIVGITPFASTQDAYLASKAAIASLMESLCRELSNRNSRLTFLAISPTIEPSVMMPREQQLAEEVVEAVKRNQCTIRISWSSEILYRISCMIYRAITTVTQWLHTQGCDSL